MSWLLSRLLVGVAAMLAGGLLGYFVGSSLRAPVLGALLGAVVAVALLVVLDTIRGMRLIAWLRGTQEADAPRDAGFWGEIGYRVERSIRLRERLAGQEQARLSRFLDAMEASPNGVLMLDVNEQIDWCNSVAAAHFGLDPQRDRLQHITNLVRAPAFVAYLQTGVFKEPVQFPDPRGRGTLSVLVRDYGEGRKLVLSQDITERERADAMRRDFVANVSHEIRTPLTVLSGFIETMASLPLTEVERKRVLLLMSQQTQRMQSLVADLLTLAQLEGSPRPAADRWVAVDKLLRQVEVDARALSMGRHALTLNSDDAAQIAGAETELLSALTNLANNAVRYTSEGGRIDIAWRVLPNGSGEFTVKDTGPGIEREHIARLTERFYRVDGSRSRDTGGTGLGLSIVKHVVQRHGGELNVQSEPGKGSTFRLVFPAARLRYLEPAPDPRRQGEALTAVRGSTAETR
ncbi:phosphate regulon sensor histidine kinase PhoR [Methylibium sp.]|uniref:phosphate regulon sensor histidine kinase PhoR n=1 Tax=Methylibium sp. TaxID=2067992 RepID=UPI00182673EE|nr:phosphate regulon sensor histidine kinase PhoR [Methylibium sp.]MBA3588407.1 phosphate regulon sensor histidine kinase PhoR [Methylibium sp.]